MHDDRIAEVEDQAKELANARIIDTLLDAEAGPAPRGEKTGGAEADKAAEAAAARRRRARRRRLARRLSAGTL